MQTELSSKEGMSRLTAFFLSLIILLFGEWQYLLFVMEKRLPPQLVVVYYTNEMTVMIDDEVLSGGSIL